MLMVMAVMMRGRWNGTGRPLAEWRLRGQHVMLRNTENGRIQGSGGCGGSVGALIEPGNLQWTVHRTKVRTAKARVFVQNGGVGCK